MRKLGGGGECFNPSCHMQIFRLCWALLAHWPASAKDVILRLSQASRALASSQGMYVQ